METLHAAPISSGQLSEPDSVSPEEIAAFLDGRVTGEEKARLEAHFADNPDARRELLDASRMIAAAPSRHVSRMRFGPIVGIAAAAVLAVVLLKPDNSDRRPTVTPAERRGVAEQTRAIDLIAPVDGAELGSTQSFAWRPIEGASYRLVIMDSSGKTILQDSTTDTVHTVPGAVLRNGPGRYYWSVDALMPDGSSTTSGEQEFIVKQR
jgi:hypothetical protein